MTAGVDLRFDLLTFSSRREAEPWGRVILGAVVSLDGYIADDTDDVGPLFDWYGRRQVEWGYRDPKWLNLSGSP